MHVAIGVLIGRILGNWILLGLLLVAGLIGVDAVFLGGAITNTAKGVLSPVGQWISERGATPAGKLVPTPTGGFQTGAPSTATPTKGPPEATPAPTAPPPNTPTATATSAPATATPTIAPATTTATATVDTNATKIAEVRIAAETAIADARKEAATAIAETKRLVQLALTPAAAATPTATATGQPVPAPSAVTPTVTPVRAAAPGAPTAIPAAPTALSTCRSVTWWNQVLTQTVGTGALLSVLDRDFQLSLGGQWTAAGYEVPAGSVFWTDLYTNRLPVGVVPVRAEGGWGVYSTSVGYTIPPPNGGGRWMSLCPAP